MMSFFIIFTGYIRGMFFVTKSPPQVVAEATHTGFPIWRMKRPRDGFSGLHTTFDHISRKSGGLGLNY